MLLAILLCVSLSSLELPYSNRLRESKDLGQCASLCVCGNLRGRSFPRVGNPHIDLDSSSRVFCSWHWLHFDASARQTCSLPAGVLHPNSRYTKMRLQPGILKSMPRDRTRPPMYQPWWVSEPRHQPPSAMLRFWHVIWLPLASSQGPSCR